MQLENSFHVGAAPDRVFGYLLDINKVVGCVPGAELTEVVDDSTFKGKVKVKVGPISVGYSGTARISDRDDAARRAVLSAEGRETTGQGTAKATATMTVEGSDTGSEVRIVTEYHIAGRVAQFGRGVMEDVSKRLVNEMAACIKANLESGPAADTPGAEPAAVTPAGAAPSATPAPAPVAASPAAPMPATTARPVGVFGMLWYLLKLRLARLFGRKTA